MLVHLAQYLHPPIPRNNKTSHKEIKTIYTYKRRHVEASHDVSDPPTKSSFIQNCDARGSNNTQCYILEGVQEHISTLYISTYSQDFLLFSGMF